MSRFFLIVVGLTMAVRPEIDGEVQTSRIYPGSCPAVCTLLPEDKEFDFSTPAGKAAIQDERNKVCASNKQCTDQVCTFCPAAAQPPPPAPDPEPDVDDLEPPAPAQDEVVGYKLEDGTFITDPANCLVKPDGNLMSTANKKACVQCLSAGMDGVQTPLMGAAERQLKAKCQAQKWDCTEFKFEHPKYGSVTKDEAGSKCVSKKDGMSTANAKACKMCTTGGEIQLSESAARKNVDYCKCATA